MSKSLVVFQHAPERPDCNVTNFYASHGYTIERIYTSQLGILNDFDPLKPDLLFVAGGAQHLDKGYMNMEMELEMIRARLDADKPTLMICLGAQLGAMALGGSVVPIKREEGGSIVLLNEKGPETGWYNDIQLTEAGKDGPLQHLFNQETLVFQWHVDTFVLPEQAVLLAENEYPQAYAVGEKGLGIQSHPETNADALKYIEPKLYGQKLGAEYKPPMPQEEFKQGYGHAEILEQKMFKTLTAWSEAVGLPLEKPQSKDTSRLYARPQPSRSIRRTLPPHPAAAM